MEFHHTSVLLEEVIEGLSVKPDGIYVDGTLGGAGHADRVCELLSAGRLIGMDQDGYAVEVSRERLAKYGERVTIVRRNYAQMAETLREFGIQKVDGITLDLGVSSFQLDTIDRGFSYRFDAPLDMRMDERQFLSAKNVVNEYSEKELFHLIQAYGEEKFAKNIAKNIVLEREREPIETTGRLAEIVKYSIPAKCRKQGGHPAKKTFQAIRIEVNRELEVLEQNVQDIIGLLKPGGRLCILTFHSLEDRIVKRAFRTAEHPCTCPPDFPVCVCGKISKGKQISKKPILPSELEMEENPRSKSAKLRIFEHI